MFTELMLPIGPFSVKIKTDNITVIENLAKLYVDYPKLTHTNFADFPITITTSSLLRRWIKPQVDFFIEEFPPFKPLPKSQAFAMFEWGLNYCITSKAHQFLIFHAGTIEKNGQVIMMPAHQGSGKSTLTAAMVYNGFRLFSDELALVSLADDLIYPCTRPINLKNQSIDVINNYIDNAVFSTIAKDTHKGTVALLKPPTDSVKRIQEPAPAKHIVFPKYKAGAKAVLTPIPDKLAAFKELIEHSFNYHVLGETAFKQCAKLLKDVDCYEFVYSDFEDAKQIFNELVS